MNMTCFRLSSALHPSGSPRRAGIWKGATFVLLVLNTQGVSLRGIGSSGASRTLVMWDGIPENDPFGGWLYWDRFAPQELERIEISRGASTSLFGDLAMGGALGLFTRPVERLRFQASYEVGNRNTHEVTAGAAALWRHVAVPSLTRALTHPGLFL